MDEINDVSSYYYDGEWLHLKAVSEYDIHEAGKAKNMNINELKLLIKPHNLNLALFISYGRIRGKARYAGL